MSGVESLTDLMGEHIVSAPACADGMVWFQGDDDKLWRMPLNDLSLHNHDGLKTLSTPKPSPDGYVYFQGEGNRLMRIERQAPFASSPVGDHICLSPPFAPGDGFVYFQGKDNKLICVEAAVSGIAINLGGALCSTTPALFHPGEGHVYYTTPGDFALWRLTLPKPADPPGHTLFKKRLGNFTVPHGAHAGSDGALYFGDKQRLVKLQPGDPDFPVVLAQYDGPYTSDFCASAPRTSMDGFDGRVYCQLMRDWLQGFGADPRNPLPNVTCNVRIASSPDPHPGFVLFQGTDNKLYRLSTA